MNRDGTGASSALADLRAARTSDGAPSARNLIVTVFGDVLLPHGDDTAISVRSLAALLESFGVNERLVRTSLTRLVNDGLLVARSSGRRSFYCVAREALSVFRSADDRIYRGDAGRWDGAWTLVVIDGTAPERARMRNELAWIGLGSVAPNVMASPVVSPSDAAAVVERVGGLAGVLVSRSEVVEAAGTLGGDELAQRCFDLDAIRARHIEFIDRFGGFVAIADDLTSSDAFKLRVLAVAVFRRHVVTAPIVPVELLPADWPGASARDTIAKIYRSVAARSEAYVVDRLEPSLRGAQPVHVAARFGPASS